MLRYLWVLLNASLTGTSELLRFNEADEVCRSGSGSGERLEEALGRSDVKSSSFFAMTRCGLGMKRAILELLCCPASGL